MCIRDRYKNQFYQLAQEKAAASTICENLAVPIARKVKKSLGVVIVDSMKKTNQWFDNKTTLKTRILITLGENVQSPHNGDLSDYFEYISDAERSFKKWIKWYAKEHCDALKDEQTALQCLAKIEVSKLVKLLGDKVKTVTTTLQSVLKDNNEPQVETEKWLSEFFTKELKSTIEIDFDKIKCQDPAAGTKYWNAKSFTDEVMSELEKLKLRLENRFNGITFDEVDNKPYKLLKPLVGCCKQCPFCGEQCDWQEHDTKNVKHKVAQHRPDCLGGYKTSSTRQLTTDLCPSMVGSGRKFRDSSQGMTEYHPYSDYKTIFPEWSIPCLLYTSDRCRRSTLCRSRWSPYH